MGHPTPISEHYLEKPLAMLEAQYVRVEPYITVFRSATDETIEELNQQLKEIRNVLDEERSRLLARDEMIFTLQKDLKETQKVIDRLPQMIDEAIDNYLASIGWEGKLKQFNELAVIKPRLKR